MQMDSYLLQVLSISSKNSQTSSMVIILVHYVIYGLIFVYYSYRFFAKTEVQTHDFGGKKILSNSQGGGGFNKYKGVEEKEKVNFDEKSVFTPERKRRDIRIRSIIRSSINYKKSAINSITIFDILKFMSQLCRRYNQESELYWRRGRVVRQRSAKPCTAVRIRSSPPFLLQDILGSASISRCKSYHLPKYHSSVYPDRSLQLFGNSQIAS